MPIKIEKIIYDPYGSCIKISNDVIEVVLTLQVGPRVIRYGFIEKENMFLENSEMTVKFNETSNWKIKGGHRLWHTPEKYPRNYVPDDDPIEWEEVDNGIKVVQELEKWTQIKKEMEVTLAPDSACVSVKHTLTNKNAWTIECGIWGETAMAPGGVAFVPQSQKATGVECNRVISLWPFSDMSDNRVYWGKNYIILKYDASTATPFKFGISNDKGWAAYINYNSMFLKRYNIVEGAKYPDNGCSFEAYTNHLFTEVESLSPLKLLEPGESFSHIEMWQLFNDIITPRNEEEVKEIEKIITVG